MKKELEELDTTLTEVKLQNAKLLYTKKILENPLLNSLPKEFPIFQNLNYSYAHIVTQKDFVDYYRGLKKDKEKYTFIYSDLINLFLAAGFNGAYILVDDFERIPDFQSAIQKKDFAVQLRTVLYDGNYVNSGIGFYNFIFALHAGVPRLMQEAWALAGLEQRIPMTPNSSNKHIVIFEKITEQHALALMRKYLSEYRTAHDGLVIEELHPFTSEAIKRIGLISEMNASHILQLANNIIDYAATEGILLIDENVVNKFSNQKNIDADNITDLSTAESINLIDKVK
jgi:hypothetical protein